MILVTTATEMEMAPLLKAWEVAGVTPKSYGIETLITGVGPAATSFAVTKRLSRDRDNIRLVLNFGICGAYVQPRGAAQPRLLDICLAEAEIFADLGVSIGDEVLYLDRDLTGSLEISMKGAVLDRAETMLQSSKIQTHRGTFLTVNTTSGTEARGEYLRKQWKGMCENMEGAAIAMVCREYNVPALEMRAVSNYVVNRDISSWKLKEACQKAVDAAKIIIDDVIK